MKFTNTLTITCPREEVFAFLADLENLPRWNYAIEQTRKVTAGPVAVGTRYHQVRALPTRQEESLEVIGLDPGRTLIVQGPLSMLPAKLVYDLESVGATTVLVNEVELSLSGPLALVSPIATRRIKAAVAENLAALREILERGRP
jgi:hypothetical protein